MAEEIEVPTEHLQETIDEAAHGGEKEGSTFNMKVALSTAILAVMAAVAALMGGHAANEAVLEQIEATDKWSFYESKSIKDSVLASKIDLLAAFDKTVDPKDTNKLDEYTKDKAEIKNEAEAKESDSAKHMKHHVVFACSVTFFQIAIALSAIAVLTKNRPLWLGSLTLGGIGGLFLVVGLL